MKTPGGDSAAGICHSSGVNMGLPPQRLTYVYVEDLDQAIATVLSLGGSVVVGTQRQAHGARIAVL